jgi:hypothetical protein
MQVVWSAGVSPAVAGASRSPTAVHLMSWGKSRSKLKAKSIKARAKPALTAARGSPLDSGRDARGTNIPSSAEEGDSVESHVIPAKLVLRGGGGAGIHLHVDPRFRGGDDGCDFHVYRWAAGPCALSPPSE